MRPRSLRAIDPVLPCRHTWRLMMIALDRFAMECGYCDESLSVGITHRPHSVSPLCVLAAEGEPGFQPAHEWEVIGRAHGPYATWDILKCHWCGSFSIRPVDIQNGRDVAQIMDGLAESHRRLYAQGGWPVADSQH